MRSYLPVDGTCLFLKFICIDISMVHTHGVGCQLDKGSSRVVVMCSIWPFAHLASGYILCVFYLRKNWRQPTEG